MKYIGVYDKEELFDRAVQSLKDSNTEIEEIFTPVPVHKAVKNVAGSSRLPTLAYILGFGAVIMVVAFLYYTAVIDWPLNIGGKPSNAFPSFIIITLILTILTVTIFSLLAFSIVANLFPGKKAEIYDLRALDNKFIIVLNSLHAADAEVKLKETGAEEILKDNRV